METCQPYAFAILKYSFQAVVLVVQRPLSYPLSGYSIPVVRTHGVGVDWVQFPIPRPDKKHMRKQIECIARGFIFQNGKVLLCKRKDRDYYFFPGGHVEFGEFAREALEREIAEEIGAKVTKCEFIGTAENVFEDEKNIFHEINFAFQTEIDRENISALEEHLEFRWLFWDEFGKAKVLPTSLKAEIIKWEKNKKSFCSSQNDLK